MVRMNLMNFRHHQIFKWLLNTVWLEEFANVDSYLSRCLVSLDKKGLLTETEMSMEISKINT
jgi:hypothetical protein